jgi:peptidyl-prolyl cis-trans isomerase SurA
MRESIFSIIIMVILSVPGGVGEAKIIDKIIAIVNGEIITLSQLERYHAQLREESDAAGKRGHEIPDSKRAILNRLIEEKLVDQQCRKLRIGVSERDIDMAIADVKRANAITDEQLKTALLRQGLSGEEYREQLREELKRAKLVSLVVRREFSVDDEALKRFYLEHIDRFKEPDQIRVSHILIMIPQDSDELLVEALRYKGETILGRLRQGEDFQQLARSYSDDASAQNGGDLGFFKSGELLPAIERAISDLRPGQLTGLVRTKMGFHIIKVTDRKGGSVVSYEEVTEKVRNQYIAEESKRLYKAWLQKLKSESFIEVKL